MDKHEPKNKHDAEAPRFPKFESTLPIQGARKDPAKSSNPELDLDLDDIQTRLPYGTEDIADK